jgi:magnesium-transporting ATPase (P-type)
MRKTALVLLFLTLILPSFALAAPTPAPISLNEKVLPDGPTSVIALVDIVADWIFTALLVLAVIFLLLAAYNYMGGSEEGVQKAHRMLIYTLVAVAVAFLAIGLVTAVQKLVAG